MFKRTKVVIEAKLGHSQTSGIRPSVLICLLILSVLFKICENFYKQNSKDFCVKTGMCLFFSFCVC